MGLENISLIPADIPNYGNPDVGKVNFNVVNHEDGSQSLPIFTAPMPSVVDENNYQLFMKKGIRPMLSRVEDLNMRLDGCQYIMTSFTLGEIRQHFLSSKRVSDKLLRISIDSGDGHDIEVLNVAVDLRRVYGNQVCIMAGNIGNPKLYLDYCKAGIDYARVGIGTGSLVNNERYGFYYPMASLLIDINGVRKVSATGLKQTKVIADGGITGSVDIVKALALGADYVMIGRAFAKLAEASGPVQSKQDGKTPIELNVSAVAQMDRIELREKKVQRLYTALSLYDPPVNPTSYDITHNFRRPSEVRDEWVTVNSNLQAWLMEFYDVAQYAFTMGRAMSWAEYKTNIRYVKTYNG